MVLPDDVRDLARDQLGVVTRSQLHEAGVSRAAVRWNVGRRWRMLLPGVVQLNLAAPSWATRLVAAQLLVGPGGVISATSAARYHGVTAAEEHGVVTTLVPPPRRARRVGWVDVRRTHLHDEVLRAGALSVSSPPRSVVDAALRAPGEEAARAIVVEAVQRRVASVADLHEWLCRCNRRGSAATRRGLLEAAEGVWSLPEGRLLALMRHSPVLRGAWPNPALAAADGRRLVSPDLWVDEVAMAVLVHSRRYHSSGRQWDETVRRDGELTAAGVVVAGVTPADVRADPRGVLLRLERTAAVAASRPRPRSQRRPGGRGSGGVTG